LRAFLLLAKCSITIIYTCSQIPITQQQSEFNSNLSVSLLPLPTKVVLPTLIWAQSSLVNEHMGRGFVLHVQLNIRA
jgi:hypothetical protein